jgi:putative DNA primase/helicase
MNIFDLLRPSPKEDYSKDIAEINKKIEALQPQAKKEEIEEELLTIRNEVLQDIIKKDKRQATEKIVRFISSHDLKIGTIRNDEQSEIFYYDKNSGLRIPNGKTLIREMCRKILEEAYTSPLANEVISKIETDTFVNQDEYFNIVYKDYFLLNNGIYDRKNKKILPFNPDFIFFSKIPITFDPKADCPIFKKHIQTVLSSEEDCKVLQEVFGYCLYKESLFEIAFVFIGDGRNGKGKTLEVLKRMLGVENCVSLTLNQLEQDQYSEALLFNKLVNLAGDIGKQLLRDTDKFKRLLGRDLVTANRKFLTPISFTNYSKLIFACNELSPTLDTTPGFFSKWLFIDFPYMFVEKEEYDRTEDKTNLRIKDPYIIDKISTPEELSGIFNWSLEGLDRLLNNMDFSKSHNIELIKTTWLRRSDSFMAFCQEYVEEDSEMIIEKKELRKTYKNYCKEHKLKVSGDKRIKDILLSVYGVSDSKSGDKRLWEGIKLIKGQDGQGFLTLGNEIKNDIDREMVSKLSNYENEPSIPSFFANYPDMKCSIEDFINTFSQDALAKALKEGLVYEDKSGYLRLNI